MGTVEYKFIFQTLAPMRFQIQLDRPPTTSEQLGEPHADWTRLGIHQCSVCPLKSAHSPFCPAALDLEQVVEQFKSISAYEAVRVEVVTPQRTYVRQCDVQTGLRSLVGLVMSTSQCPWFQQLRALAQTHLPFSNLEETLFRVVGAYLAQQYFVAKQGGTPDFELRQLEELYRGLSKANEAFKRRLEFASIQDANVNAVCALSIMSHGVSFFLSEQLQQLQSQLAPFPMGLPEPSRREADPPALPVSSAA